MPRKEKITVDISAKTNVKKPLSETAKLRVQLVKVIKLNEELTAENARLLMELEGITLDKNMAEEAYNDVFFKYEDILQRVTKYKLELSSIKSKWWYKLMTWGWN